MKSHFNEEIASSQRVINSIIANPDYDDNQPIEVAFKSAELCNGDLFYKKEIQAYCETAEPGSHLLLTSSDLDRLRTRIIRYCGEHGLVATTTKINNVLCFTFGGPLHIKKPVRRVRSASCPC